MVDCVGGFEVSGDERWSRDELRQEPSSACH